MQSRTLSELAKLTGLKPRTLQFWAQSGVLIAEQDTVHRGPGVHRKYPQIEAEIACILAALSPLSMQVGALNTIAATIRSANEYGMRLHNSNEVTQAIEDEELIRLKIENPRLVNNMAKRPPYKEALSSIADRNPIDDESFRLLSLYRSLCDGRIGKIGVLQIGFSEDRLCISGTSIVDEGIHLKFPANLRITLGMLLPKAQT